MVKEYIEREPVLKQIRAEGVNLLEQEGRRTNEVLAYGHCFGIVNSAPAADVVEVVRCKDCGFCTETYDNGDCWCSHDEHLQWFNVNHFCSYGKRKDNETD